MAKTLEIIVAAVLLISSTSSAEIREMAGTAPAEVYDGSGSVEDALRWLGAREEWLRYEIEDIKSLGALADPAQVVFARSLAALEASRDVNEYRRLLGPGSAKLLDEKLEADKINAAIAEAERVKAGTFLPFGPDVRRVLVFCRPVTFPSKGLRDGDVGDIPTDSLVFVWRDSVNHDLRMPQNSLTIGKSGDQVYLVKSAAVFPRPRGISASVKSSWPRSPWEHAEDGLLVQGKVAFRIIADEGEDRSRCVWVPVWSEARLGSGITRTSADGTIELLMHDEPDKAMLTDNTWKVTGASTGRDISAAPRAIRRSGELSITLDRAGAEKLAKLTGDNAGRTLGIIIDGRVVAATLIESPIADTVVAAGCLTGGCMNEVYKWLLPKTPVVIRISKLTFPNESAIPDDLRDKLNLASKPDSRPINEHVLISIERANELKTKFIIRSDVRLQSSGDVKIENDGAADISVMPDSEPDWTEMFSTRVRILEKNRISVILRYEWNRYSKAHATPEPVQTIDRSGIGNYEIVAGKAIVIPIRYPYGLSCLVVEAETGEASDLSKED